MFNVAIRRGLWSSCTGTCSVLFLPNRFPKRNAWKWSRACTRPLLNMTSLTTKGRERQPIVSSFLLCWRSHRNIFCPEAPIKTSLKAIQQPAATHSYLVLEKKTQKHHETPFCTTFTVAHLTLLALGIKNYSVLQEQLDRYTVYLSPINPTGGLNCKKHMRCREEHDLQC